MRKKIDPIVRFMDKVLKQHDGCWRWTGAVTSRGYGSFGYPTRSKCVSAHRFSYSSFIGPIEAGKLICHKCDNKWCVNPDHLFMGTGSDNMMDCVNKGRHPEQRKTHCIKGHEYDLLNTKFITRKDRPGRFRDCRECRRAWKKQYRMKQLPSPTAIQE